MGRERQMRKRMPQATENIQQLSRNTLKVRRYRDNLRKDPERLEEVHSKERERKRRWRKMWKEYMKSHPIAAAAFRKKEAERMRRYRARKKAKAVQCKLSSKESATMTCEDGRINFEETQEECFSVKPEKSDKGRGSFREKAWQIRVLLKCPEEARKETSSSHVSSSVVDLKYEFYFWTQGFRRMKPSKILVIFWGWLCF